MAQIISMHRMQDASVDNVFKKSTPTKQELQILEKEFPLICNDLAMLLAKPFRLIWDSTIQTAATDCIAEIRITPQFFLQGLRSIGYGSIYHECGHILFSPYGAEILAGEENDILLVRIINMLLDRKDDWNTVEFAPGFADVIRQRLVYICTMGVREKFEEKFRNFEKEELDVLLKNWKPKDVYEDFFFAAKWHKRARFKDTHRAMKHITRAKLQNADADQILYLAKKVRDILGDSSESTNRGANLFILLIQLTNAFSNGRGLPVLSPSFLKGMERLAVSYVKMGRQASMNSLLQHLNKTTIWPGPLSVGKAENVKIEKVKPRASNTAIYQQYLSQVSHLVEQAKKKLKALDNPSEFTLYGQEEGDELDFDEVGKIACSLNGFYKETIVERNIDAEIHLAIDCSGSMEKDKVETAKQLATLFSESILSVNEGSASESIIDGHVWGYNSIYISDFGPVSRQSGFVNLLGSAGNSDTDMLKHVGTKLSKSQRKHKVLIVFADDGPDGIVEVNKLTRLLLSRGIIVIHMLIGVHGTPEIYPFELPFTSMDECLNEFGDILVTIINHLK